MSILGDHYPAVAADSDRPRTLVLCFDGTANHFAGQNTNVVRLVELLVKDRHKDQLCYYQAGVGTYFKPGTVNHFLEGAAKALDLAVAWYLDHHVMDGYNFLMSNWRRGDRICMFGFSRGAYIARALAGVLHKVGLLPKDNAEQVSFAYKLYKRTDKEGIDLSARFKRTFSRAVTVDFLGVFDTVSSVGVLFSRNLPFTDANTTIRTFRHALALDEHRARFQPNLYHNAPQRANSLPPAPIPLNPDVPSLGLGLQLSDVENPAISEKQELAENPRPSVSSERTAIGTTIGTTTGRSGSRKLRKRRQILSTHSDTQVDQIHQEASRRSHSSTRRSVQTDVQEVWFAGCHSDVGGGSVSDGQESLADISLRWMVREVTMAQCGVIFDNMALTRLKIPQDGALASPRLRPHAHPIHISTSSIPAVSLPATPASPPRETLSPPAHEHTSGFPARPRSPLLRAQELNASAATRKHHDEMKRMPLWWLLELFPIRKDSLDGAGGGRSKWSINFGRGRRIPDIKPHFHSTVKERMANSKLKYKPRASWFPGTERYVD